MPFDTLPLYYIMNSQLYLANKKITIRKQRKQTKCKFMQASKMHSNCMQNEINCTHPHASWCLHVTCILCLHAFGPNTVMRIQARNCMQKGLLACMQHVKFFVRVALPTILTKSLTRYPSILLHTFQYKHVYNTLLCAMTVWCRSRHDS